MTWIKENKYIIFPMIILIICIFLVTISFYSTLNVLVRGKYKLEEENIREKNGEYYLLLDEHELYLSNDLYKKIKLEKNNEYGILYYYNELINKDAKVLTLNRYED